MLAVFALATAVHADSIDRIVESELKRQNIPGASIAVIRDGKVIKARGYGFANLEWKIPANEHTVYQIQSITKTFTSAIVMRLIEQGKLKLDDPINNYLQGAPPSWEGIQVRHLLSHTSGIKDFINEPVGDLRLELTEDEVYQQAKVRPLDFAPGEQYAYSNTNYHLLAIIIRKLTGKYYGDVIKDVLFDPLGMKQTRILTLSEVVPNRASGYVKDEKGKVRNGHYVAESILSYAGGGIMSTALDLAKWDIALYGEQVLSEKSKKLAWAQTTLNNKRISGYGLGWVVNSLRGHPQLAHSGGHLTGFGTVLIRFPKDKLGVVVLTNAQYADAGGIAMKIATEILPGLSREKIKAIKDKDPEITQLLKKILVDAAEGQIDSSVLSPEMAKVFTPQVVKERGKGVKALGTLKKLELLNYEEKNDMKLFAYRVTFEKATIFASLAINKERKVAGLQLEGQ